MSSNSPRPSGSSRPIDEQRADMLRVLRISPMPGGALRQRFGHSIQRVLSDAYGCGLVTLVDGDWYLTQAGQIAARGGSPS